MKGGENHETKKSIETVVWNIGGSSTSTDLTASMFYSNERDSKVYNNHSGFCP